MKTALQELISYFEQQKKQGCKNWCVEDLLAQLYQAKEMEKEQIIYSNYNGQSVEKKLKDINIHQMKTKAEQYYNETFKSE